MITPPVIILKASNCWKMGLVSPKGYLPLDSQIYVGDKNRSKEEPQFKEQTSAVAKDYKNALKLNKNQMVRQMLKRTLRGIQS